MYDRLYQQLTDKLSNTLDTLERESICQRMHWLETEHGYKPRPASAKRPKKNYTPKKNNK